MTTSPTIGVFALQGDVFEHVRVLSGLGADAVAVRRPAELAQCDALVLPGGESTTMEKLAHSVGLFEPLRQRIGDGMPTFGTCAGMILLADSIVLVSPVHAVFIRAPRVERAGAGVDILATVDSGEAGAHPVAVRQGGVLATSFHPEAGGDGRVHAYFVEIVRNTR